MDPKELERRREIKRSAQLHWEAEERRESKQVASQRKMAHDHVFRGLAVLLVAMTALSIVIVWLILR